MDPSYKTLRVLLVIVKLLLNKRVRVVFEFGSRYGEDTVVFASSFPFATVFGFECNPNTLAILKQNVKPYNNIKITEAAVGDKIGKVKFYPINAEKTITTWEDGNQGASSLFKASGKYEIETYIQDEIEVDMLTLEYVMDQNKIESVDVLWMDIQGAEMLALKGLGRRIKDVRIIHTEVEFIEIYENQPLFKDVHEFLLKNDFIFYKFNHKGGASGDAIFINKTVFPNSLIYLRFIMAMWIYTKTTNMLFRAKKVIKGGLKMLGLW